MKRSFSEALQHMLYHRDLMLSVCKDASSSLSNREYHQNLFINSCKDLDEAHKISLMDLIAGDSDVTQ